MQRNKFGFTLVEMLIIAPIVILLVGSFIALLVNLTGDALAENAEARMLNDVNATLDQMEADVNSSGAFLAVNNFALTSPQGLNNDTTNFTNVLSDGHALILNVFVSDKNPDSSTRALVYLANMPNACGSGNFGQNQVMTMNVVYFVKDNSLWRRTLAVNNYATKACAGAVIWQNPSCAPGVSGTLCRTQDEQLITAVDDLTISTSYFVAPADTTAVPGAISGSDTVRQAALDTTRTVDVTINADSTASGREFSQSGSLRMTRSGTLIKYATPS